MPARHSDGAAALTRPRARVLELLQQLDSPVSAEDVALRFDQHVNTVRLHLEYLAQSGLALRERAPGTGRGRPSWHYRANPDHQEPDPRVREYGALAGALAAHIVRTSTRPEDDAYAAGLEWGRQEARERHLRGTSSADARRSVVSILAELGFAPAANDRHTTVHLTTLPAARRGSPVPRRGLPGSPRTDRRTAPVTGRRPRGRRPAALLGPRVLPAAARPQEACEAVLTAKGRNPPDRLAERGWSRAEGTIKECGHAFLPLPRLSCQASDVGCAFHDPHGHRGGRS